MTKFEILSTAIEKDASEAYLHGENGIFTGLKVSHETWQVLSLLFDFDEARSIFVNALKTVSRKCPNHDEVAGYSQAQRLAMFAV